MKKALFIVLMFALTAMSFISCDSKVDNSITFRNSSSSDAKINFRAKEYDVASGTELILKELPKGIYPYETLFTIPQGFTSPSIEGQVAGDFTLRAGTNYLMLFTSGYTDSTDYTIYVSLTTSDDQTPPETTGP